MEIISETVILDTCEALLELERLGTLYIRRYHELPPGTLNWIRQVQPDEIRKGRLLYTPGEKADYCRTHYPESWTIVEQERPNT